MDKTTSALLGVLVFLAAGLVIWVGHPRGSDAVAAIEPEVADTELVVESDAGDVAEAENTASMLVRKAAASGFMPGFALLDGTRPPPLPSDAPKQLRFGVVLVQYQGAERAPKSSRNKVEALELSLSIAQTAREDFAAAVDRGDEGSTASAGLMPQRVLEPAIEYVLFTTPPGEVGGPVDTPTGFWIVKNTNKPK